MSPDTTSRGAQPLCAEDLKPVDWINFGFTQYCLDRRLNGDDGGMKHLAQLIVRRVEDSVAAFPANTKAGRYITCGLQAAFSFGAGLDRQHRILNEKRREAHERREACRSKRLRVVTRREVLRAASKMILIGGLAFSLIYAILGVGPEGTDKPIVWFSIAGAFASLLASLAMQSLQNESYETRIDNEYHAAIAEAKAEQAEGLEVELELALKIVMPAWKDLTNCATDQSDEFLFALKALNALYGRRDEALPRQKGFLAKILERFKRAAPEAGAPENEE